MAFFSADDDNAMDRFGEMFGPEQVDSQVREALRFCWMSLPKERRSIDLAEAEFRRMVERAIRDFREDRDRFGQSNA
ncbi:MAG: hypothetical protein AAGF84_10350 [Planctomycetota bacterium]